MSGAVRMQRVVEVDIQSVVVSPFNVRHGLAVEDLDELAASIRAEGIQNPLLTRKVGDVYEVVAGARRLAAAKKIGLETVPCLVREMSDREALAVSFVENDQRKDMDPVSRAAAIRRMLELEVEGVRVFPEAKDVAQAIGRSKQSISDQMAILRLVPSVQKLVREGVIGYGPAVAIGYKYREEKDQLLVVGLIEGLKVGEQKSVLDALRHEPGLLSLSRNQLRQNLSGVLSEFSSEERQVLRALHKRVGLDPDNIKWSSLSRAQYEKDVASKRAYLRRHKELRELPEPTRVARVEVESVVPAKAAAGATSELDLAMDRAFESIRRVVVEFEVDGRKVRVQLSDLQGLQESDVLKLRALLASHVVGSSAD